ncbi:hypothetical protein FPSE_08076 [Fusarium pseudograminearum CS3096]|uniref:Uncharacterized protein n=1 Tax=Fusarium pseudograminearum (strain CS3096) TaxID=1028729 RepID=K3VZ19_FUSPC|nr:hypothetical protein FPSE_08076 [Fusarium pseudograminearum CS3096]EKJ71630.1 hypothetical protein FPSE_08076 [Fusarium pseudograminearum CS3096]KAF0635995.1 hypothetical protein FPSE5266_08076 [Fusarium pseudograminearum]
MRLIQYEPNGDYRLERELGTESLPKYAILSHTWMLDNEGEVSLRDLTQGLAKTKPEGCEKIRFCGERAAHDGLNHFWVDTCCIDQNSSAVLEEAITSMYAWYRDADRCYVYLWDITLDTSSLEDITHQTPPIHLWESAFRRSRWFTRGWTLQELLAPQSVEFFTKEGICLGDKSSLESIIHQVTGIPVAALRGTSLTSFSIEERLRWTENRQTKRKEDKAYCLLGIFGVLMNHRYGEGDKAFERLRRKIENNNDLLSTLPMAKDAAFNSLHNQHEPICLEDTRSGILNQIRAWAEGSDSRCIFWLNGIAGTGKSTIARTIARVYYDVGALGGSYFFSKGGGDLSKANRLVTTLAGQLAAGMSEPRRHISEAIATREDIMERSLRDQWKHLIIDPLSKIPTDSTEHPILLVIDALDECDDENDIRAIIKFLVTAQTLKNFHLRILITSRPETPIRHGFNQMSSDQREVFVLEDISPSVINQDIGVYFQNRLKGFCEERGFDDDSWPDSRSIMKLVENASGLFIWAATACRFICKGSRFSNMEKRLKMLIHGFSSGDGPEKKLDQIYITVIRESAMRVADDEKSELYLMLRQVIGAIAILYSPLAMEPLSRLVDLNLRDVKETLNDLHTIFYIPKHSSAKDPRSVRLHHPTFRDFLLNKDRCIDLNFFVDEKKAHRAMGDKCIALMSKMLRKNICHLDSPGTTITEPLEASQINKNIPPDLQYACLYWVEHYRQSGIRLSDGDAINQFFKRCFLNWLEAMNLMGKSLEMGAIIRLYHSLLMPDCNQSQIPFVKDARRLMFTFQNIMRNAPLQIYCAALAFIPLTNELRCHFRHQQDSWIQDVWFAEADIPKPRDDFNYVSDLAFTPDSRRIASGSNFEAIRFWDVATKSRLRKFEGGATDKMSSVAISPDGKTLAGGSDDFTVMVWSIETGALHYSIKAHTGWVNSVVFSPDGTLLASGSMDQTVALWDVSTGQEVKRIDNQSSCVNSATFSPNGAMVATGSVDGVLRVWHPFKSSDEMPRMLDGHSGPINSVRYSPSGSHIVSGSDDMMVRLWNCVTEASIIFKGHTKKVMAVAFAHVGHRIASGSEDKTVRVWDATSGACLSILLDHTSGINSVVFSPDCTILASSSFDDEVRLWDLLIGFPSSITLF